MQSTMKALVKKYAEPGLWLEEVPVPETGINDVLIQIHKTAICGTDVHIWNWDAWSQKTIPVPMVIGHEFVGTVAAMGSNVHDLQHRRHRVGRGAHRVRALPQLPGRAAASVQGHPGRRRQPARRVRGVSVHPGHQRVARRPAIPLDILSIFDPFGNATHTALSFNVLGEDVLITGAGPIGIMADRHRQARRRALRGHDRHEPLPAGPGQEDGRHHRARTCARRAWPTRRKNWA